MAGGVAARLGRLGQRGDRDQHPEVSQPARAHTAGTAGGPPNAMMIGVITAKTQIPSAGTT
jgi:hypothetical protein